MARTGIAGRGGPRGWLVAAVLVVTACGGSDGDADGGVGDGAVGLVGGSGGSTGNGGSGGPSSGAPVTCSNSLDCVDVSGGRQICHPAFAQCVMCAGDPDCEPHHDCIHNECVAYTPCINSLDCTAPQVCDAVAGRCVECVSNADCDGDDLVCAGSVCRQACSSDRQCTPLGQLCHLAAGHCAECLQDADCSDERFCTQGSCQDSICAANTAWCQGNAVIRCNARGDGVMSPENCGGGQACIASGSNAGCQAAACTPGQTQCASNTELITCASDGQSVVASTDCGASGQSCYAGECIAAHFVADFEGATLPVGTGGWTLNHVFPIGETMATLDANVAAAGSAQSLRLTATCSTITCGTMGAQHALSPSQVTHVTFWARTATTGLEARFLLRSSSGSGNVVSIGFTASGMLQAGSTTLQAYEAERWYEIQAELDWEEASYAVRVDGQLQASAIDFGSASAEGVDQLRLEYTNNFGNVTSWWDQILIQ